ncbi:hypothetical protein [Haloprofundus halophilus]|uniref:hypothetical protein n=1 Tax=Haloprofundus halophilus TaxID=2283527 RepID=UPI000E439B7E|nr:hypothetical protein [Haloprofundus halophilus]
MSPTRRTLLKTAGLLSVAALAGCTSNAETPGGDDSNGQNGSNDAGDDGNGSDLPGGNDSGGSDGTRPAGTGGPGVVVSDTDDAPEVPVAPSVELTEDVATDDHPPQLRVTITNESDRTVRLGEGRDVFFQYVSDTENDLILLPAGGEYDAEPGCWRLAEPIAITSEYRTITLEPGASKEELVDLYATPGEDACLPVGEFRFEATYTVLSESMESEERATWGFSLSLE